jgi:LuxR family maltose regulon positive regulatory protein
MEWATNRSDTLQRQSLLTTKLQIPRIRTNLVARPSLNEELDEGLRSRLTIISAPAGYGKTTLLAGWAQRRKQNTAWIALDASDDTPSQFWAYFIGSLQVLKPGIGATSLQMLESTPSPAMESVLTRLINDLSEIPDEVGLVLDDYHVITAPSIHTTLAFFIERMPAQIHLFLTSRVDPPLPLTRLRARAELIQLGSSELRFTLQEVATFLKGTIGETITTEEIAELANQTEGWIAGLQLAASSLYRRKRIEGSSVPVDRMHRYVDEYLAAEVLETQPQEVQKFLLRTSLLERMCGALCDAVTETTGGEARLEELERANLFIVPLDNERQWYRYHNLFAQVLHSRLKQSEPEEVLGLHIRASQWYEENGYVPEAVEHLMRGGEIERAVRIAEQHAETLLSSSNLEPLLHWVKSFPDEQVSSRPRLSIAFAWALLLNGQMEEVEKYLEYCRRSVGSDPTKGLADIPGHLATVSSFLKNFRENEDRQARQSQAQEPGFRAPDLWQGPRFGVDADARAAASASLEGIGFGGRFGVLESLPQVAQLQMKMGQLGNAARTCHETLDLGERQTGAPVSPASAMAAAYLGLAEFHFERNDLDSAMQDVAEGIKLGKAEGDTAVICDSYVLLARIHQARGDLDGALDALDEAERLVRKHHLSGHTAATVATYRVRVWLAQGNLQAAAQWSQRWKIDWMAHPTDVDEMQVQMLARVFIAQYRSDEALELLAPTLAAAEAKGWNDTVIRTLVLQALALDQQGDLDQAISTLSRALKLAQPEEYIRIFTSEGAPMIRLLLRIREAIQNGEVDSAIAPAPEYLNDLLGTLGVAVGMSRENEPKVEKTTNGNGGETIRIAPHLMVTLPTPLSDREIEVLKLIAEGKTNAGIADSLYISVSTVKTHINNLYSKLGVETRTQALARAREYHLL